MLTPALNRPPPDVGDTHFGHAPGQHRSLPSPDRRADALPVPGPDRSSLRRPLMVLATGTFAIGTDAFVIGGVLPAVARSLGVSTSSAGLLVTAFAVAYALGAPILAVVGARLARRTLLVSALAVFAAANVLAAVAPSYALMLIARVLAALAAAAFVPAASAAASSLAPTEYRGRALATVVAGMTVAQVAGVPFGAFVGASLGGCRRSRGAHPGDAGPQRRHRSVGRLASTSRPRRMGSGRLDLPTFSAAPSDRDSTRRRKRSARPQQLRDIRRCRYRGRGRRPGTARRRRFRPRPRGRARRLRPHLRCGAAPLHATRHEKSRRVQSVSAIRVPIW
jgi:Major Facilitator Superfamily